MGMLCCKIKKARFVRAFFHVDVKRQGTLYQRVITGSAVGLRCWMLLLVCGLTACANRPDTPQEQQERIDHLAQTLQQLAPSAPLAKSRAVATVAVQESAALRQQYGVRFTPWLHNVEVNSGTRSRGFCYHYARDLRDHLQAVVAPYWRLYPLQARAGTVLEHNAVGIIGGSNQDWQQGIVLDAWRDAGVLYFGPVQKDKYPWRLREP